MLSWKWPVLVGAGLLASGAVLIYCKAIPGCLPGNEFPRVQSSCPETETPKYIGDETMSVTQGQKIQHVNDATFRKLVLESEVPVLVDFYADWCGPCQRLTPVLQELAAETPNAKVVKVNVDDSPALASEYGVDAIPSLKVFQRGRVVDEQVGLASKSQLRAMLVR